MKLHILPIGSPLTYIITSVTNGDEASVAGFVLLCGTFAILDKVVTKQSPKTAVPLMPFEAESTPILDYNFKEPAIKHRFVIYSRFSV